jgi:polar amino acid transport system substrate-binding protein
MKRFLSVVFLVLVFQVTASSAESVLVTGHSDRAPFDWQEGEYIRGAAVEIIEIVLRELDIEVESRYVGPWARALLNLEEGSVDIMCGVYATPERRKFAEFSVPFKEWRDLEGKRIGDILGASRSREFDKWRKVHGDIEYVSDNLINIKKLEKGRIDCFVMSHDSGVIFIKSHGYGERIVPLEKPVDVNYLCYGISKKSPILRYLTHINKRLDELRADGTIDAVIRSNRDAFLAALAAKKPRSATTF